MTFKTLRLPINLDKSHCVRIGPRHNFECVPLQLGGALINWTTETTFLGVTFCKEKKLSFCLREIKKSFYLKANTDLGRIGTNTSENLVLKLINSQGLQSLVYDTIALSLSKSELSCLDFAYNSIFVKLFKVKSLEYIKLCQYNSGCLPFTFVYELRRYNFLSDIIKRKILHKNLKIDECDYRDYYNLQLKYNLNSNVVGKSVTNQFWNRFYADNFA